MRTANRKDNDNARAGKAKNNFQYQINEFLYFWLIKKRSMPTLIKD